jgi:hypothetical protein
VSLIGLCPFGVLACLLASLGTVWNSGFAQAPSKSPDAQGILAQLAPDDVPPKSLNLNSSQKTRAVRLLAEARREGSPWHRELATYLLAMLGHNYMQNRDELLRTWRKDGDPQTTILLMDLYEQGHQELLHSLLAGYSGWNAAVSEGLGTFFSDELNSNTRVFLGALAQFSPKKQTELCIAAGSTDGGGMAPETERAVLANLRGIGGDVAERCARGVRRGNKDAADTSRDPSEPSAK